MKKRISYNHLLLLVIILGVGWVFTLLLSTASLFSLKSENMQLIRKSDSLKNENKNLNIEVKGLIRLMELKDQDICHYSHEVVKHEFRVINKK